MKHRHDFQFVERGYRMVRNESLKKYFKINYYRFVCPCGKMRLVREKK